LVARRTADDPEPLEQAGVPFALSTISEDELLRVLEQLSKRHGFALELAG
jgi:hypothetical protein